MMLDALPRFLTSLAKYLRESMSGKREIKVITSLDQVEVVDNTPYVLLLCRAEKGRTYSSIYADRRFLELSSIAGAFEYRTKAYQQTIDTEEEAARLEQKLKDAEAKKAVLRNEKRSVLMALRELERQHVAAANAARIDLYDPGQSDEKLDDLDLNELRERFEGLTKKTLGDA